MHYSNNNDKAEDFIACILILFIIVSPLLASLSLVANGTSTIHSTWAGVAGSLMILMHYVSNKTRIGSNRVINTISILIILMIVGQLILHIS